MCIRIQEGCIVMRKQNKSNIEILRNYVDGVRPYVITGYTGKKYKKQKKIGDRWKDSDGTEWEQKAYGRVKVNRVADIVRAAREQKCKCGQAIKWGSRIDQIFFNKTGMCSNCIIDYETKLRILGLYDNYEKYKMLSNEIGNLKDIKTKLTEVVKFFSENNGDIEMICNSEGFTERWKNTNKDEILQNAMRDLEFINKKLDSISIIKEEEKRKYIEGSSRYGLETYV